MGILIIVGCILGFYLLLAFLDSDWLAEFEDRYLGKSYGSDY
jgi:hypothetical protein